MTRISIGPGQDFGGLNREKVRTERYWVKVGHTRTLLQLVPYVEASLRVP